MVEQTISKEVVAVIDIGSSAIRMVIAEVGPKAPVRHLENLQKPVRFGKDVFKTGRLSNDAIREGIDILKNYKVMMESYGVRRFNAIATSAVREAANRDNFVDQVFVRAGIDVEILEDAEENRLELMVVEDVLKDKIDLEKKNVLIIEVGTGHTEIILMTKGEVKLTRALPIGSLRLPEQVGMGRVDSNVMQRLLKRSVHTVAEEASREYSLGDVDTFVAMGGDMRLVCRQLVEKIEERFVVLKQKDFLEFIKALSKLSPEEMVGKFQMTYEEAEMFYPSLLIYADFLAETKSENIIVPLVSIRDGLLLEISQLLSGLKRTDLSRQVTNSAKSFGRKYKYDEAHALCVTSLSMKLFDCLKEDHGLGSRERLLLEVASLLHDIGMYISATGHHKHSAYLVAASEIFGLRKVDKDIVANVVRYHRRSAPQTTHVPYMSLPKSDRPIVSKLAAILRVTDALDRVHQQKIRDFTFVRQNDHCQLWVLDEVGDLSLERQSLLEKSDLFSDVFGMSIVLKQGTPQKQ